MSGTVGASAAQFLLSLVLLNRLPPEEFGRVAFLLLVAQFIWAVEGALFAAPLARIEAERRHGASLSVASRNDLPQLTIGCQAAAVLATIVSIPISFGLDDPLLTALIYGLFVGVGGLRVFCRIAAYSAGRQDHVVTADAIYVVGTLGGVGYIAFAAQADAWIAYTVLLASALAGLLPLMAYLVPRAGIDDINRALRSYTLIWRRFARWSLIGLVATEATLNAHSYIVTLFLGPQAFVSIAASSMLIRPGTVALNALSELERPRMAHHLVATEMGKLRRDMLLVRLVSAAVWLATVLATIAALVYVPTTDLGRSYDIGAVSTGAALWATILLVRSLYLPEAIVLQAHGAFGSLAFPKIWSAPVSIISVILLLQIAEPIWSLAGIAVAEAMSALLTIRGARPLLHLRVTPPAPARS